MKTFDQFVNESLFDDMKHIKFKHFEVGPMDIANDDSEIDEATKIISYIKIDVVESLKVADISNVLFLENSASLIMNISKLIKSLGLVRKEYDMQGPINNKLFKCDSLTYNGYYVSYNLYKHKHTFDSKVALWVCLNPEYLIKHVDTKMMLIILNDPNNRKILDECLGYPWVDKWLDDRRGAAKMIKYDL